MAEKSPTRGRGENIEFLRSVQEKYREDGGTVCPYCGHDDVEPIHGKQSFDEGEFLNRVGCTKCKKQWTEVYKLHRIYPDMEL